MKWIVRSAFTLLLIFVVFFLSKGIISKIELMKKPPERSFMNDQKRLFSGKIVTPSSFTMEVDGFGTVQPAVIYNIVSEVSGRVVWLYDDFNEGNLISEDQEILKIDPARYEIALLSQKASIERMEIELKQLGIEKKNTLKSRKLSIDEKSIHENEHKRNSQLLKTKAISKAAFDASSLQLQRSLNSIQTIDNALALFPVREETLKKRLEIEKIRLRDFELNLKSTSVTAPFSGIVENKSVEMGEWVSAGKSLGRIYSISEIEIPVPLEMRDFMWIMNLEKQADLKKITNNESVKNRFGKVVVKLSDNGNTQWEGQVSRIDPMIDPSTRTIRVIVSVKNPFSTIIEGKGPPLKPGMFCRVYFEGIVLNNCYRIPALALKDGNIVYTGTNGRLKAKKVNPARLYGEYAYITEGLEPNDIIINSVMSEIVDGITIEVKIED